MTLLSRLRRLERRIVPAGRDDLSELSDEELLERVHHYEQRLLDAIRDGAEHAQWTPEDRHLLRRAVTPNVRAQLSEEELQSLGIGA